MEEEPKEQKEHAFGAHPFLRGIVTLFTVMILLCMALYIRRDVYLMPHLRGDQRFFIGLAMKIDKEGISGYTLRGIDIWVMDKFYVFFDINKKGKRGSILEGLSKGEGVHYYDMPLLTTPPLLSCALMISHNILEPGKKYMIPVNKWKPGNKTYTASQYTKKQFYAIVVPLLFSCLLILFVFLLGKSLFGFETATWAAFLMVICPTDILTSQKVWADDMVAFFVILAVFLFVQARKRDNWILSILAGISAGLGAITKQTGGFIVFAILLYYLWISRENILNRRWKKFFFDKHLILFFLFSFLTILPWYGLITKTYGKPWYIRQGGLIDKNAPWFRLIRARSKFIYLVNIPAQTPVLFLAYFIIIDLIRRFKEKDRQALLFFWMVAYLYFLRRNKEERYVLPAISAAAIISGYYLHRIRVWLDLKTKLHVGKVLIVVILILSALWSIPFGRSVVLRDGALIRFPF